MIIREALRDAIDRLARAGIESASLDARLLLQHILSIGREELLLREAQPLEETPLARYSALLTRRAAREPIAQILGRREFWGMEFEVTGDTLAPRPDSETVIEALLRHVPGRSKPLQMLDLGTGTGCLLLSALSEYPLASGLGLDRSASALAVAGRNATALGLKNRVLFKNSDWNSEIKGVWDVILSNPPYIPTEEIPRLSPEVAKYEPIGALDGGDDGLHCYRAISRFLPSLLAEGGIALLEVGAGQANDVAALVDAQELDIIEIACDLAGIERCVIARK